MSVLNTSYTKTSTSTSFQYNCFCSLSYLIKAFTTYASSTNLQPQNCTSGAQNTAQQPIKHLTRARKLVPEDPPAKVSTRASILMPSDPEQPKTQDDASTFSQESEEPKGIYEMVRDEFASGRKEYENTKGLVELWQDEIKLHNEMRENPRDRFSVSKYFGGISRQGGSKPEESSHPRSLGYHACESWRLLQQRFRG